MEETGGMTRETPKQSMQCHYLCRGFALEGVKSKESSRMNFVIRFQNFCMYVGVIGQPLLNLPRI